MKLIRKYWFFLFLLFLIVILFILKIKYSNQTQINEVANYTQNNNVVEENNKNEKTTGIIESNSQLNNSPTPTKKIIVTSDISSENYFTTNEGETINANDYREDSLTEEVNVDSLEVLLPYTGNYFTATKYSDNGYLEIRIKNEEDFDKAQEELGKWLEDNNTNFDETIRVYYFD